MPIVALWNYEPKTKERLTSWYYGKKQKSDFLGFESFYFWYEQQDKKCVYCGLTERESYDLVRRNKLTSKRFPENGVLERGRGRGLWLEVDRKDPHGNYSSDNCALCCYFCNNDKSDIFNEKQYRTFIGEEGFKKRVTYLRGLLNQ